MCVYSSEGISFHLLFRSCSHKQQSLVLIQFKTSSLLFSTIHQENCCTWSIAAVQIC